MPYKDRIKHNLANQKYRQSLKTLARHCLNCCSIFYVNPKSEKSNNFCSRKCLYESGILGISLLKYATQPRTEEWKKKIRESNVGLKSGNKHPNWKGGITNQYHAFYNKKEIKPWRRQVLELGDYKCAVCGTTEKLHCHHIISAFANPELAFNPKNGIVLCSEHHYRQHAIRPRPAHHREQSDVKNSVNSVKPINGNTEPTLSDKEGVETRHGASLMDEGIVQTTNECSVAKAIVVPGGDPRLAFVGY